MVELDRAAAARGPSGTACYPLSGTGERFPFVAAGAEALWTAPPEDEVDAYRAVLEGVAFVERLAYERLAELGAAIEAPQRTAGGGGRSRAWSAIRATVLDMAVVRPESADSAFGACILAAAGTLHEGLRAATDAMVAPAGAEVVPVAVERDRMEESYGRVVAALVERGWLSWRK
jgi:xylulokinase